MKIKTIGFVWESARVLSAFCLGWILVAGTSEAAPAEEWEALSNVGAPTARQYQPPIWTGSEMMVWGGLGAGDVIFGDGARYNAAGDSWAPVSGAGAPGGRLLHAAVWTGSEVIVWGGFGAWYLNDGSRYNPTTDMWTPISTVAAPDARHSAAEVWTGSEMIVWGGSAGYPMNSGGRYNPTTDTWTAMSTLGAPVGRYCYNNKAVWTGTEMIVWGGYGYDYYGDGARYNPTTDTWTPMSGFGAPSTRWGHMTVWTGSEMIVWGGYGNGDIALGDGARYNPTTDSWTPVASAGAPSARYYDTATWTGSDMIVYGGFKAGHLNDGARYDPVANTWAPLPVTIARSQHNAVWTGSQVIVWGGADDTGNIGATYSYTPGVENSAPIAVANASSLLPIVGEIVSLDGSASADPDDDAVSFLWTITSQPPGSATAVANPTSATASFTPDLPGAYEVTLAVSDYLGSGTPAMLAFVATTAVTFAEAQVTTANATLAALPAGQVTTAGNQSALGNFLTQAIQRVQAGNISGAIAKLNQAIERADGCALRGAPDGNGAGKDWITDCGAQAALYDSLVSARDALQN